VTPLNVRYAGAIGWENQARVNDTVIFLVKCIYAWLQFVVGTLRDFSVSSYERENSYSFKSYIMYL
jgi:hypothetical protein